MVSQESATLETTGRFDDVRLQRFRVYRAVGFRAFKAQRQSVEVEVGALGPRVLASSRFQALQGSVLPAFTFKVRTVDSRFGFLAWGRV